MNIKEKRESLKSGLIEITKSRPMTYTILKYLASEGVFIAGDEELPENRAFVEMNELNESMDGKMSESTKNDFKRDQALCSLTQQDMLKAGFKKCYPLI